MDEITETKNTIPIRFHFFKITFTPYKDVTSQKSHNILTNVVTYLSQEMLAGKGLLVDRHEGRKNQEQRPLFVTNIYFMMREKRVVGSLALLRKGRIPYLKPAEKFTLIPLDTSQGEIAEQT